MRTKSKDQRGWPTESPAERGYGSAHKALRRRWAPKVASGTVACARCGLLIDPGVPWDLGHVDGSGKTEYAGPEHRKCNRATSGRTPGVGRKRKRGKANSRRWL